MWSGKGGALDCTHSDASRWVQQLFLLFLALRSRFFAFPTNENTIIFFMVTVVRPPTKSGLSCVHRYFMMAMVDDYYDNLEAGIA